MVSGGHASGATVDAVIVTFTAVAALMTAFRLLTRIAIVKNAGKDDVFIGIGMVFSVLVTVTMCQQVVFGMGRHENTLTAHDGEMSLRWFWASVWMYYLALWAVKISILCQYLRIFPEGGYRTADYVLMCIITAWTLWAVLSAIYACTPIKAFWDTSVKGRCLDRLAVWFANAAVNILTDIATAILPIPALRTLRLPAKQKNILIAIFSLGVIVCVISIMRLQSLYVISKSTDISWDNPMAATYSSLEVNVGIICSCIPTLKGLISRLFPSLRFGDSYNRTMQSRNMSVTRATDDLAIYAAQEFSVHDTEDGPLQSKTEEEHESRRRSCPPRGSHLLGALSFRDSRIKSHCPGLTEEQVMRERNDTYMRLARFEEKPREHELYPGSETSASTRRQTAPCAEIRQEERARAQVKDFVERRPNSRKGVSQLPGVKSCESGSQHGATFLDEAMNQSVGE